MLRFVSVSVALFFVTTSLAASGAADPDPADEAPHPLIDSLMRRDAGILEGALADNDAFRALMATPVTRATLDHLLARHGADALVAAVERVEPGPLFPVIAAEWSSQDGAAIASFLVAQHDATSEGFAFDTAHPLLDAFVARLTLANLVIHGLEDDMDARVAADFESFLDDGTLPHGWSLDAAPAPAVPEPAPSAQPQGEAAGQGNAGGQAVVEDLSDIAEPAPHPMAGLDDDGDGVVVQNEGESRTYFISSCNLCGASMMGSSGALIASFDLSDIPAELISEGSMMINTFDVDWFVASPCGTPIEKDTVYLNGNYVGHLTGANNQWSTSTMNLDPSWFVDGSNTINLYVDTLGNGCWAATTAWLQVDINAEKGDVIVDDVETDKDGYNLGDAVEITAKVHTDAEEPNPYPAQLEFQLRNPSGDIPAQNTISISLPADGSQQEFTRTLTIPGTQQVGTPEVGTWTAVVVAFDKDGVVSDRGDQEIGVGSDVSIEKEQLDVEILDNNPDSGSTEVKLTGSFGWASALDETQPFKATIYVEHDGAVTSSFDQDFTIPGKGSGDFTLDAQTLQLDGGNEPAIRVVVDAKGDVVEVNEDNNEAVIDDFGKPEIVELKSRLKGNFMAEKALDRPNDYTATTKDPEVGKPIEKVVYTIKGPGGTAAEGESSARGSEWEWSHDVGTFSKGKYTVSAVAVTEDGVESDPKEIEFWTFDPPSLIHTVASALSLPILDLDSPQDRGDHERYWGNMEVSLSIDLIDAALGPGADLAKAMFQALIGKKLCLNVVKVEIGVGAGWGHEVLSDKSTWKLDLEGSSSVNVFGKTSSVKVKGTGTWTFGGGDWDLTAAGLTMTWGLTWSCNVLNVLLGLIPPPVGDALVKFNEQFKLAALVFTFGPNFGFTVGLKHDMPRIAGILPVEQATVNAGATLSITGSISAGGKVSAGATVSGNGVINVGYTGQPQNVGVTKFGLCDGGCGLDVWAEISFWWVSAKKTFVETKIFDKGELIWPKSGSIAEFGPGAPAPAPKWHGWETVETVTPTAKEPAPAAFAGGTEGILASGLPAGRTTAAVAAGLDGSLSVAYDLDDFGQPVTGSPEIAIATTAGADAPWQDGLAVAGPFLDTTPDVAVAADGSRVVAWERITAQLSPTDNPFDFLADNKIFLRTIAPDGSASEPVAVAPEGGWQFLPRVATSADGKVAVVSWLEDGDGDIETPDRRAMVAAVLNGEPQPAEELAPVGGYGDAPQVLVLPSGAAVAVYSLTDGPLATRAALRVGDPVAGVWEEPVLLSEGEHRPDQVRLAADAAGLTVAWVETVDTSGRIVARTLPGLPTPDDLDAGALALLANATVLPLDDADPHIVRELSLVTDATGARHYVWFDPARQAVRTLTVDATSHDVDAWAAQMLPEAPELPLQMSVNDAAWRPDRSPTDILTGDFATVDAAYRPVANVVSVVGTRTPTDSPLMELVVHERSLGPDAAVLGVETSPANPEPGSVAVVTTTIQNVGGETLPPQELIVTSDGVVIGVGATPVLAAGRTGTASFEWTVPDVPKPNGLTAYVDAHGVQGAGEAADDIATATVTLPDLVPVTLDTERAGGAIELVGTVQNDGVIAAPETTARFVLPDGTEVGRTRLAEIPAGGAGVASVFVGPAAFVDGINEVTLVVDTALDFDPGNDAYTTVVPFLPDLAVVSTDVGTVAEGRPANLRTVVQNQGAFASAPTELLVELDGTEAARVPVPSLLPGASRTISSDLPVAAGAHALRVEVNPDRLSRDGGVANDVARLSFETKPAPFAFLDEASLVYRPDGVEVRVQNGGNGLLTLEDFALYRGAPQDRPAFGPAYVTKVDNLFAVGGVGGVPGHSSAAAFVPAADIAIRVTSPDRPNSVTRLADLAPHETVSVRLDPFGTDLDAMAPHMVIEQPLVSVSSPSHPDPGETRSTTQARFDFSVVPGRVANGYSFVLDQAPDTVPDTAVDTTAASVTTTLPPGTHWMHVRSSFSDGWSATDHYPVRIAASDAEPPTTRLAAHMPSLKTGPAAHLGTPDTMFSLNAIDDLGVVTETRFAVDGGAEQTYNGPFQLPVGTHTITYRSVDPTGNVEMAQAATIEVEPTLDTAAPTTTHAASPGPVPGPDGDYVAPGSTVALTASDPYEHRIAAPSGIGSIQYQLDGAAPVTYTGAFPLPAPAGPHVLDYWSTDVAGNRGETMTWSFTVDDVAPSASFASPAPDDIVAGPVAFVVAADDAEVGVAGVLLSREGEPLGLATDGGDGTWSLEVDTTEWPLGNNDVEALVWDGLGHEATAALRVYAVGRTVQLGPAPADWAEQHDPHLVTDEVEEVTP